MSYPSPQPRKLHRSRNDRWIGGVCGGLAEYLNMDPTLVRVLVVVIAAVTAALPVAIIYLILMAVLPESRALPPSSIGPYQQPYGADQFGYGQPSGYQQNARQPYNWSAQGGGYTHTGNGAPTDPVWGPEGAPWQQSSASSSDTPPPRQSAEDLFSRAKHPSQPSSTSSSTSPSTQD
jgi:phage shock protein PspC (stress-responsive transcriptional regulator)